MQQLLEDRSRSSSRSWNDDTHSNDNDLSSIRLGHDTTPGTFTSRLDIALIEFRPTRNTSRGCSRGRQEAGVIPRSVSSGSKRRRSSRQRVIDHLDASSNKIRDDTNAALNDDSSETTEEDDAAAAEEAQRIRGNSAKLILTLQSPHLQRIKLVGGRNGGQKHWSVDVSRPVVRRREYKVFQGLTRLLAARFFVNIRDREYERSRNDRRNRHRHELISSMAPMSLVGGSNACSSPVKLVGNGEIVNHRGKNRSECGGYGKEHGTRVHDQVKVLISSYLQTKSYAQGFLKLDDDVDLCTLRFLNFMSENNWTPVCTEYRMYDSNLGIATAADVVVVHEPTLHTVFLELKTGGSVAGFSTPRTRADNGTRINMRNELRSRADTPLNRAYAQCLYMVIMMQSLSQEFIPDNHDSEFSVNIVPHEFYVIHVPSNSEKPVRHFMPPWVHDKNNRDILYQAMKNQLALPHDLDDFDSDCEIESAPIDDDREDEIIVDDATRTSSTLRLTQRPTPTSSSCSTDRSLDFSEDEISDSNEDERSNSTSEGSDERSNKDSDDSDDSRSSESSSDDDEDDGEHTRSRRTHVVQSRPAILDF
jgi:hypothetical protein